MTFVKNGLGPAMQADVYELPTVLGPVLRYYSDTGAEGRPLVLLHSINAAPSAMEMLPLFEHYRTRRPVFAPDLPGFGLSERGDQPYSPDWFARVLAQFLSEVPNGIADVVALSTTAELVTRAVVEYGAPCRSLTLISPTGFSRRSPPGEVFSRRVERVLHAPVLGASLFRGLTSRASIAFFLRKAFVGEVPKPLLDYAWQTAREPGARYAPFAFLAMRLFTKDAINQLYSRLDKPTLVLFDRDPNIDFDRLPDWASRHRQAQLVRIEPTLGMPHWEQSEASQRALETFWAGLDRV